MNIVGIVRFVSADCRLRADKDVELLLSVADFIPESWVGYRGTVDFLQFQHAGVELSSEFQVVDRNKNMMKIGFVHERRVTSFQALGTADKIIR